MPTERFVALQGIAITAAIAWLLYLLASSPAPYVVAAILARGCAPWVSKFGALGLSLGWRLPRSLAVAALRVVLRHASRRYFNYSLYKE